ncbi:MAG: HesA/MoeB/ThiF family protein [Kiritimatiellaeota bacterium]|nr:HesA/MoeB/ThiF family protein [Kiritimatiellota bacterium]
MKKNPASPANPVNPASHARYLRQAAVTAFGEGTQAALASATIAIVGCGALGSLLAETFTRMGAGALRIADADTVALSNLHRQFLFTEADAAAGIPKVIAGADRLRQINADVKIEVLDARVTAENIDTFFTGADVALDATDNVVTRFLINDWCVRHRVPWVYAGVSGVSGLVLPVLPDGPCLRCLYPDLPPDGDTAHPDRNGILPPTVTLAVSLQTAQTLRILNRTALPRILIRLNVWDASVQTVTLERNPACPCCGMC